MRNRRKERSGGGEEEEEDEEDLSDEQEDGHVRMRPKTDKHPIYVPHIAEIDLFTAAEKRKMMIHNQSHLNSVLSISSKGRML